MLTPLTLPPAITFARNQTLLRLRSTDGSGNLYRAYGDRATLASTIGTSTSLTNGQTITLSWTEYPGALATSVVFTAATTPTLPEHLPVAAGTVSSGYVQAIKDVIAAHPKVAPFFRVTFAQAGSNLSIVAEAKDTTAAWAPGWATSGPTGWGASTATRTADNTPTNYRILVSVFFETAYNSGNFNRVANLEPATDGNGEAWVDLQPIFQAEWFNSQSETPIPQGASPVRCDNLRRYYIRYTEASGATLTISAWTTGATNLVMWGGVSHLKWSAGNYLLETGINYRLLHWYPNNKTISEQQPEWLAWYNNTGAAATVHLRLVETNDAGIDGAATLHYNGSPITVQPYETATFPIGPTALGIAGSTTAYAVTVMQSTTEVSNPRTYMVDTLYYEDMRFIQYLNGFGVPETLRTAGRLAWTLDIERSTSRRAKRMPLPATQREILQWEQEGSQKNLFRSGYLRRNEMDALQELFLYNQAFQLLADGSLQPIFIEIKTLRITETGQNLHAVEFSATPSLTMGNYDSSVSGLGSEFNALPDLPVAMVGVDYWAVGVDFVVS
jgi:hypothetical protein